jgi:hypothetical protein
MGVGENGAKTWITQKYSPTHQRAKMWNMHYELQDHARD